MVRTEPQGKTVTQFLKRYSSKNTRRAYRNALVKFLSFVYDYDDKRAPGQPPDLEVYDELALRYIAEDRDRVEDIMEFMASVSDAPGMSKKGWKSVVVTWLAACKIFLHPAETRSIRVGGDAWTEDRTPTPDELRRILQHLDQQMQTYVVLLACTGMRPSEAIQLRWGDLDMERRRIRIRPESTKTRRPRTIFFSVEAAALLADWQQFYPQFCERRAVFSPQKPEADTELVFPINYSNVRAKFQRALKKAGVDRRDPSTRRHELHLHALRKFFRTRLPQGGVGSDVAGIIMGHRTGLDPSYLRLTTDELEQHYRKAEHMLWIHRKPPINAAELKQLETENMQLRDELRELRGMVERAGAALDCLMRAQAFADKYCPDVIDE